MLSLNFNPFPTLHTERLVLREVSAGDAAEIFFLRSNEQVLQYLDKAPATSVEEAAAFIQRIQEDQSKTAGILWGITVKNSPNIIGTVGFWQMQKEHYRAEIGYALHPGYQGRGIMDEALKAVLAYGFETMKLHSVEANINPANNASRKLLEKNGFIKEAYFKENYFFNGRFIDSEIYSLLAPVK
jgi:ribosomal-protein-alanine N-acetyltransferase